MLRFFIALIFGLFLANTSLALSSVCSSGGGFSPYIRHAAGHSPSDFSWYGQYSAVRNEMTTSSPLTNYPPIPSFMAHSEFMGPGWGTITFTHYISGFGIYSWIGKALLGYGNGVDFWPIDGEWMECSGYLHHKQVLTSLTLSKEVAMAGETIQFAWSSTGDATYCDALQQLWPSSGIEDFVAAVGDAGTHVMLCANQHHFDTAEVTLSVCDQSTLDSFAKSFLNQWPGYEPSERGITFFCNGQDNISADYQNSSFHENGNAGTRTGDPCRVAIRYFSNVSVGGGHSHPYFTTVEQVNRENGCHNQQYPNLTLQDLPALNLSNNNFGPGDLAYATTSKTPLYLITPTKSAVKRLNVDGSQVEIP